LAGDDGHTAIQEYSMTSTEANALDQRIDDTNQPHPLPPKLLGELVAREVLRVSWMARKLGVEDDALQSWDDDICPPWPQPPVVPRHVWGFVLPEPDEDWLRAYHLGLSLTLAQADGWQRNAPIVRNAFEKSTTALGVSMR
jgi:hypothetical protein